jgi:hypothetical protein
LIVFWKGGITSFPKCYQTGPPPPSPIPNIFSFDRRTKNPPETCLIAFYAHAVIYNINVLLALATLIFTATEKHGEYDSRP